MDEKNQAYQMNTATMDLNAMLSTLQDIFLGASLSTHVVESSCRKFTTKRGRMFKKVTQIVHVLKMAMMQSKLNACETTAMTELIRGIENWVSYYRQTYEDPQVHVVFRPSYDAGQVVLRQIAFCQLVMERSPVPQSLF